MLHRLVSVHSVGKSLSRLVDIREMTAQSNIGKNMI